MKRALLSSFALLLPSLVLAGDFERGAEALAQKDCDLAVTCFNACIRAYPRNAYAYNNRGLAFFQKKDYDRAISDLSEAIRLDPRDAAIYYNRGNCYASQKDFDKALHDFDEAIRLDPNYAAAYYNRGNTCGCRNELDRAVSDLSEAIRLAPGDAESYVSRGNVYRRRRQDEKAVNDYTEAIRLDPKNASAHTNLALLLAASPKNAVRDGNKAVEMGMKACALSSERDARPIDALAAAHAECGDFTEAIKWEKRALELIDDDQQFVELAQKRLKLYREHKPFREE